MERLVSKEVSGKLHVYMPGNGTKYEVLISSTPYGDGSFLLCWLRAGEKGLGQTALQKHAVVAVKVQQPYFGVVAQHR